MPKCLAGSDFSWQSFRSLLYFSSGFSLSFESSCSEQILLFSQEIRQYYLKAVVQKKCRYQSITDINSIEHLGGCYLSMFPWTLLLRTDNIWSKYYMLLVFIVELFIFKKFSLNDHISNRSEWVAWTLFSHYFWCHISSHFCLVF